ncbi:hypothetical protein RRG08_059230 [Elysia crispata]|uniref:Uncharacterized protein n=1 Tax=Elysia crispata TaxID=231223 RepID=A0AAE0ZED8_9GAST|nr:hypothetical protein RRG08_059230 [Elysia crispata]
MAESQSGELLQPVSSLMVSVFRCKICGRQAQGHVLGRRCWNKTQTSDMSSLANSELQRKASTHSANSSHQQNLHGGLTRQCIQVWSSLSKGDLQSTFLQGWRNHQTMELKIIHLL